MQIITNYLTILIKGICAGLAIGLGSLFYVISTTFIDGEIGKAIGSLLFAIGLFLVCTFYFNLYTGKIGLIYEKIQDRNYYISLPIMYIGNAIGAIGLGCIAYLIFKSNEPIMANISSICSYRTSLNSIQDFVSLIIKSMLCGLCVYLAVKCFSLNRLKFVGTSLLVLFVFMFVYSGYQHCIANMFYFGMGNHFVTYTFLNLFLVTLGNSIGPIFGVLLFKLQAK